MFSLICVWINGWVNNREAGDLRRHHFHHDFIVMNERIAWFLEWDHRSTYTIIWKITLEALNRQFWKKWIYKIGIFLSFLYIFISQVSQVSCWLMTSCNLTSIVYTMSWWPGNVRNRDVHWLFYICWQKAFCIFAYFVNEWKIHREHKKESFTVMLWVKWDHML